MKADRTPSPTAPRPVIVVAGCSSRLVERATQAAEAVRCDVYAVTLAELGAAALTHGPLVIVMPTVEYWGRRADYDVRAEDMGASIVPVANDRVDQDELEGLFMAAVSEAQRRRAKV